MAPGWEIEPLEVKQLLDTGQRVTLVDVREERERDVCQIQGSELIPMGQIPQHLPHLEALAEESLVVILCHHGVRSLNVVNWLRRQGVENCQSMRGGIDAWSKHVDARVPTY